MNEWTIAVAATFTADPVVDLLRFWVAELELDAGVSLAPYDQVFQQLLDGNSVLGANRRGVNAILFRPEDMLRRAEEGEDFTALLLRSARELCSAVEAASTRAPTPQLVVICPMSPAAAEDKARRAALVVFEDLVREGLGRVPGAQLALPAELEAWYPVEIAHSPGGDEAGHLPYTEEMCCALATLVARKVHGLLAAPPKVVAVDADQTLWSGVCGEDGPSNVRVDAPRQALQRALRQQMESGALLCLCSKNEEADVAQVLEKHPDMLLRSEDFVARRVSWRPKSQGLRALAEDLRMGLETFLFLDDSPMECAEVESSCPEVRAVRLPEDPSTLPRFLEHLWVLDRVLVTKEDRQRTEVYRQNVVRERLRRQSMTLRDFLGSLNLQIEIAPAKPVQLKRLAQLSERTTQLNATARRFTEGELRLLIARPEVECLVVSARDRFGDYGLVGAMLVEAEWGRLLVRLFLLSCRALGRGIEHRMLAALGQRAKERGLETVEIPFAPTRRNAPAAEFLRSRADDYARPEGSRIIYRIPAEVALVSAEYPPPSEPPPLPGEGGERPDARGLAGRWRLSSEKLFKIATTLDTPARILAQARGGRLVRPESAGPFVAPRSALERFLASAWAELLNMDRIGIQDDFFDLGGHSLLAVQVVAKVRDELQVSLPLETISEAPTVAALADQIASWNAERRAEIEMVAQALPTNAAR